MAGINGEASRSKRIVLVDLENVLKLDLCDGIYDDGEWMCGGCISRYAHD